MNCKKVLASAIALSLLTFTSTLHATPYASGVTNNSGTINFILNENADDVAVIFDGGTSTNDLGALSKGTQSFTLDAHTNYQIVVKKSAGPGWRAVTGATNGISPSIQISTDSNPLVNFFGPRGISVNRNPKSPYFGRIYVGNDIAGNTSVNAARTTTEGIYLLNADTSDALGQGATALTGGIPFGGVGSSPWRIHVGDDDNLYICDWSDTSGNLYQVGPNIGTSGFVYALKQLSAPNTAKTPVGAANNHGSVTACYTSGSTAAGNLKIYTIDEDLQSNKTTTTTNQMNSFWEYDANGTALPYTADPTRLWTATPAAGGGDGYALLSQTMDVDRAPDGKFYLVCNRSNGGESGLIVRDATGGSSTVFSSKFSSTNSQGGTTDVLKASGSVAVSADGLWVVTGHYSGDGNCMVLPITNGIPDISKRNTNVLYGSTLTTRAIYFDAANNLYAVNNGNEAMRIFSPGGTTVTTYTNDVTGTNGSFSSTTIEPLVWTQPVGQAGHAGTNDVNLTVVPTASGPFAYQWQRNGTNIAAATKSNLIPSANLQQINAGSYRVIVTNVFGAVTSSVAVVTVIDSAPIITVQPISITSSNAGSAPKFTVTTIGTDTRSYQWQFNGTNIAAATTSALTITDAQDANIGSYQVIITNSLGSVTSSVATLGITDLAPIIITQPVGKTNYAGSNVTFTVTTQGTDPRSYQWLFNGNPISGATVSTYSKTNLQNANGDAGTYSVVITNILGSITSSDAILAITDGVAIVATQPKSLTNGAGVNLTFTVAANGTDPRTYQWNTSNALSGGAFVPITDATNTTYIFVNPQMENSNDQFQVVISDPSGSTTSANVFIKVTNAPPTVVTQPVTIVTNAGSSVVFSITAQGEAPLGYQWTKAGVALTDGGNVSGSTTSTLSLNNVQISDAAFYRVTVASGAGVYSTTSSIYASQLIITNAFTLGTGTGLRGDYYTTSTQTFLGLPTLTRLDTNVDFSFGSGSPDVSISVDRFTARWTGQVSPLYSQAYTFYVNSDDGARLWINGQLVIDRWISGSLETNSSPVTLTANQKYDLVLEYFEGTSTATARLNWASASQAKSAIPMTQLYPASLTDSYATALSSAGFNVGGNIQFNWIGTQTLQSATNLDATAVWTNVFGPGVGPYTFTNTAPAALDRFFRLKAN